MSPRSNKIRTTLVATVVSKRVGDVQQHPQWGVLLDRLWVR